MEHGYALEGSKQFSCDGTSASVHRQLHFLDFFVNIFQECDDEINELVLEHGFSVEIGDKERDIVAVNGLAAQDDKSFCTLHQETHESSAENFFNFIGLLNFDGETNGVDGDFNQYFFLFITSNADRWQKEFLACPVECKGVGATEDRR